jgi:hypothetical protein
VGSGIHRSGLRPRHGPATHEFQDLGSNRWNEFGRRLLASQTNCSQKIRIKFQQHINAKRPDVYPAQYDKRI